MTSEVWFYRHEGRIHGPVSATDLRAALALKFVGPTDLVRRTKWSDWAPAAVYPELAVAAPHGLACSPARSCATSRGRHAPVSVRVHKCARR